MSTSSYGMRTSIWGEPAWFFSECVAFGYPQTCPSVNKLRRTARWYYNYVATLPCVFCRRHGLRFLRAINYWSNVALIFESRKNFCYFLYFFHSKINHRLHKPNISWQEFSAIFEPFHTSGKYACVLSISTKTIPHHLQCNEEDTDICTKTQMDRDMDPAVWGCCAWFVLACVARDYPVKPTHAEESMYAQCISDLRTVLPHQDSRQNVRRFLRKIHWKEQKGKIMTSRETFSKFICEFHNHFNRMLGKPVMEFKTFVKTYDLYRSKCKKNTGENDNCIEDEAASDIPLSSSLFIKKRQ